MPITQIRASPREMPTATLTLLAVEDTGTAFAEEGAAEEALEVEAICEVALAVAKTVEAVDDLKDEVASELAIVEDEYTEEDVVDIDDATATMPIDC